METQAAPRQKALDEAVQQKQAESTVAKLQHPPQHELQRHEDGQLKPVSAEAKGSEAAGLLARAKALVGQGNIRAARDVLELAAETGSAQATFALAETYDPNILATWRTLGTRSDAKKARDLYSRAYEGGIKAAKDRSQALVIARDERKPAGWFGRE
jgi:TPR repeat protein